MSESSTADPSGASSSSLASTEAAAVGAAALTVPFFAIGRVFACVTEHLLFFPPSLVLSPFLSPIPGLSAAASVLSSGYVGAVHGLVAGAMPVATAASDLGKRGRLIVGGITLVFLLLILAVSALYDFRPAVGEFDFGLRGWVDGGAFVLGALGGTIGLTNARISSGRVVVAPDASDEEASGSEDSGKQVSGREVSGEEAGSEGPVDHAKGALALLVRLWARAWHVGKTVITGINAIVSAIKSLVVFACFLALVIALAATAGEYVGSPGTAGVLLGGGLLMGRLGGWRLAPGLRTARRARYVWFAGLLVVGGGAACLVGALVASAELSAQLPPRSAPSLRWGAYAAVLVGRALAMLPRATRAYRMRWHLETGGPVRCDGATWTVEGPVHCQYELGADDRSADEWTLRPTGPEATAPRVLRHVYEPEADETDGDETGGEGPHDPRPYGTEGSWALARAVDPATLRVGAGQDTLREYAAAHQTAPQVLVYEGLRYELDASGTVHRDGAPRPYRRYEGPTHKGPSGAFLAIEGRFDGADPGALEAMAGRSVAPTTIIPIDRAAGR